MKYFKFLDSNSVRPKQLVYEDIKAWENTKQTKIKT